MTIAGIDIQRDSLAAWLAIDHHPNVLVTAQHLRKMQAAKPQTAIFPEHVGMGTAAENTSWVDASFVIAHQVLTRTKERIPLL